MLKTIIFDFDGVILESVDVKTNAFAMLFSDHPEHRDAIVNFHLKNGGMSRFDKFRIIYSDILKKPLSEEHFSNLCKKFEGLVFKEVIKCDFVKGAFEFLEKYKDKYFYFIVSATPQNEIEKIVDKKGLTKYFKAVYGSPLSKNRAIEKIIKEFNLKKDQLIFIGDSVNDFEAAKSANVRFIARDSGNCGEWSKDLIIIKDLSHLLQYVAPITDKTSSL